MSNGISYNVVAYRPEEKTFSNVLTGESEQGAQIVTHVQNEAVFKIMMSTQPHMDRVIPTEIFASGYGPNICDKNGLLPPYGTTGMTKELVDLVQQRLETFGEDGVIRISSRAMMSAAGYAALSEDDKKRYVTDPVANLQKDVQYQADSYAAMQATWNQSLLTASAAQVTVKARA